MASFGHWICREVVIESSMPFSLSIQLELLTSTAFTCRLPVPAGTMYGQVFVSADTDLWVFSTMGNLSIQYTTSWLGDQHQSRLASTLAHHHQGTNARRKSDRILFFRTGSYAVSIELSSYAPMLCLNMLEFLHNVGLSTSP